MLPLGPDSSADVEIQSMHPKDRNLILPCLPSQTMNAPWLPHCRTRALQNTTSPHPHLLLVPPEIGNPEKKRLKLSQGVEGGGGVVREGIEDPNSSSGSVTS